MVTTDIILVLYGDRKDLDICVDSIKRNCKDYNLIIIDNNEKNRGFTIANNEGIRQGSAPFVWVLNQDAIVLPGALEALINRMGMDERIGIVGSMQVDKDDPDIIRHGGTLRAFPAGCHAGGRISNGDCLMPTKQTWVNFASVLLRRKMIEEIGLLDDNLFLIYSDSDYCYWSRYRGWSVWYEPDSRVIHKLNASKSVSEWHRKDMIAFMNKWGIVPQKDNTFTVGGLFHRLDSNAEPLERISYEGVNKETVK